MIAPEKMSLSDFVSRRLNPVKVTINLLKHELAHNSNADRTEINRALLGSAVSTLELFVEDYEKLISATAKASSMASGRQFVEDAKPSLLQGT